MNGLKLMVDTAMFDENVELSLIVYKTDSERTYFIQEYSYICETISSVISAILDKINLFDIKEVVVNKLGLGISIGEELEMEPIKNIKYLTPDKASVSDASLKLHNNLSTNIVFDEKFGCVVEENYSIVDSLRNVHLDIFGGMVIPKSENVNDEHEYKRLTKCLIGE